MTDRFRKRKSRRRWLTRGIFLVTVAVVWRLIGPGIAVVRNSSVSPALQPGDIVLLERPRRGIAPGDVVISRLPISSHPLMDLLPGEKGALEASSRAPRIVVASGADFVAWTDRRVTVRTSRGDGSAYVFSPLHSRLTRPTRQRSLTQSELFLVALEPGRIDSRVIGPVDRSYVSFRVSRIIWPADRRAIVDGRSYLPPQ